MFPLSPSPEWRVRLEGFRSLFTQPGFRFFCAFLLVLAHTDGRRWVTSVVLSGLVDRHFTRFYGFLRRGVWSVSAVRQQVLEQCLERCVEENGRLFGAVDDSVCAKRGKHFDSLGIHHDPMNKQNQKRLSHGHCFVCLAFLAQRCRGHFVALFVSAALYVQEKVRTKQAQQATTKVVRKGQAPPQDEEAVPAFATKLELAVGLIGELVFQAGLCFIAVADGAYAKREFVQPVFDMGYHVLSRLRSDAVFYDFPEAVQEGQKKPGRPRTYGNKHKAMEWAEDQSQGADPWQSLVLTLYGKSAALQIKTREVMLRRLKVSARLVAVRWGDRPIVFLFCTDQTMSAAQIVCAYCARFAIETGFRDAKQSFRLPTYQVRREKSILRLVHLCLWAQTLLRLCCWNQKPQPLYGDWRKPLDYLTLSQQKRLSQARCRVSYHSTSTLAYDEMAETWHKAA
jgi:hypothetical protein